MLLPDFYVPQSPLSDPGPCAPLLDKLPDDLTSLCQVVQSTYMHYFVARQHGSGVPKSHIADVDTRQTWAILARIAALSDHPLTEPRPPEKRFVGCCRDAALLLCAMLRHKGIPARIRVGFARYINIGVPDFYVDHVVTEYWDESAKRWKLVDAEQSPALIARNHITFNVQDIPRDQFLVGGAAWQLVRTRKAHAATFGLNPKDSFKGTWAIRDRLVHDLAALNKVESLLWDSWGLAYRSPAPTKEDSALLDRIAALTAADPPDIEAAQALYTDPRLKAPLMPPSKTPLTRTAARVKAKF